MLNALHEAEQRLPTLLRDGDAWQSVFVDYHPPFVERLWRQWGRYRIYLHHIHPCGENEALFHPHPWPSAMRVLGGTYEMVLGFGAGEAPPPRFVRLVLGPGSEYEMIDPDGWHFVRPLAGPTMSLMVAGKPWDRPSPKSDKLLDPLRPDAKAAILAFFREHYPQPEGGRHHVVKG
ncbi:MAG: hypothetical protein Q8R35_00975 [bacterium]|nr:hypothetical protein [bacterium]